MAHRSISVIMTVRNDPAGCAVTLDSLLQQTHRPDEIIVVDGGSTDQTLGVINDKIRANPRIRLLSEPGANIARGRNVAVHAARGPIIASIDGGCRAEPEWLERLAKPFETDDEIEFVAGFYRIEPQSLLEEVVGLATMRGQLDPIKPDSFNPSARSLACTKSLWQRAGGWPEWLGFSEDTLFDHKVRRMKAKFQVATDAVVRWRPRGTLRAIARQFYNYGTGRGHTQIGAPDFAYNLRNIMLCAATLTLCAVTPWAAAAFAMLCLYFYVWTFHDKALRIARRTNRRTAYALCLLVMWVVLVSNLAGYLVGSWQRRRNRNPYRANMDAYLAVT